MQSRVVLLSIFWIAAFCNLLISCQPARDPNSTPINSPHDSTFSKQQTEDSANPYNNRYDSSEGGQRKPTARDQYKIADAGGNREDSTTPEKWGVEGKGEHQSIQKNFLKSSKEIHEPVSLSPNAQSSTISREDESIPFVLIEGSGGKRPHDDVEGKQSKHRKPNHNPEAQNLEEEKIFSELKAKNRRHQKANRNLTAEEIRLRAIFNKIVNEDRQRELLFMKEAMEERKLRTAFNVAMEEETKRRALFDEAIDKEIKSLLKLERFNSVARFNTIMKAIKMEQKRRVEFKQEDERESKRRDQFGKKIIEEMKARLSFSKAVNNELDRRVLFYDEEYKDLKERVAFNDLMLGKLMQTKARWVIYQGKFQEVMQCWASDGPQNAETESNESNGRSKKNETSAAMEFILDKLEMTKFNLNATDGTESAMGILKELAALKELGSVKLLSPSNDLFWNEDASFPMESSCMNTVFPSQETNIIAPSHETSIHQFCQERSRSEIPLGTIRSGLSQSTEVPEACQELRRQSSWFQPNKQQLSGFHLPANRVASSVEAQQYSLKPNVAPCSSIGTHFRIHNPLPDDAVPRHPQPHYPVPRHPQPHYLVPRHTEPPFQISHSRPGSSLNSCFPLEARFRDPQLTSNTFESSGAPSHALDHARIPFDIPSSSQVSLGQHTLFSGFNDVLEPPIKPQFNLYPGNALENPQHSQHLFPHPQEPQIPPSMHQEAMESLLTSQYVSYAENPGTSANS